MGEEMAKMGLQGIEAMIRRGRHIEPRDTAMMFEKIDLAHAAVAFDLRHIRAGSGPSFEVSVALLKEHLGSVNVRDVQWTGPCSKKLSNVPLDTGIFDRKTFASAIKR